MQCRLTLLKTITNIFGGTSACGTQQSHCFSTQGSKEIKKQIRELYKKVHPDLFSSLPEAQRANEKSFKLLQEYLTFAKDGGPFVQSAGVPYRFEFFLHGQALHGDTSEEGQKSRQGTKEQDIKRVSVVLPPPGRLFGQTDSNDLSLDTQRAISKLLNACGLKTSISEDLEDHFYAGYGGMDPDFTFTRGKLSEFIREAAELVRQNETRQFGPKQQLSAARAALKIGRQASVEFVEGVQSKTIPEKITLLQQLGQALDRAPEEITGLTFLLGIAYGSDKQGRVRLDANDDTNAWAGYMWQIDMDSSRRGQQTLMALKSLEASVSRHSGFGLILSSANLALENSYRECLERLASFSSKNGPVLRGSGADLALKIVEDRKQPQGIEQPWSVDSERGAIFVPVNAPAQEIYNFCKKHGPGLSELLSSHKEERQKLEHLRHNTERRLLLRKLTLDLTVSISRLRAACLRLTQNSEKLKGLFDGLSVRISHTNKVTGDRSDIDVAWNFEV